MINMANSLALCAVAAIGLSASSARAQTTIDDKFDYDVVGAVSWSSNNSGSNSSSASVKSAPDASSDGRGGLSTPLDPSWHGDVSIKFYDDGGGCPSVNNVAKAQMVRVVSDAPYTIGVGVVTTVERCKYVARSGPNYIDTGVVRSVGWRHFRIVWGLDQATVYVDGSPVHTESYCHQPNSLQLGDFWPDTGVGPAWFDDVDVTTF
ncbi:uncharacterized protein SOCE26_031500 [Sorangium cellulosum]|uniref:Secreted protein n=1 Tax=Sorangium cellulosum TaxID=56 RepID=A0A2L0EQY9_SORCE|nr:hypothetical protein [Sorangium cellulosum]AUX41727.1 uncharacterized protein SOCE26_031500 [Sorangium cellulosum]